MQHLHQYLPGPGLGLGQIGNAQFRVLANDGLHIHLLALGITLPAVAVARPRGFPVAGAAHGRDIARMARSYKGAARR